MRKYLEQANELAGGTTSKYLELVKKLKEEEAAIRRDIKLSTHGQDYAIGLLKKDFQEELISLSKQVKRDYLYKLEQAKKEAEKVLINPVKKADEQTMSKYTQQVNELKAKVMLAIRPEAAVKLVTEFVDGITDPYVASQFRKEFASVIGTFIPSASPEAKQQLAGAFDKLETSFITEEVREARNVLEEAESMAGATMFSYTVLDNAKDTFGAQFVPFINNPDDYTEEGSEQTNQNEGENL